MYLKKCWGSYSQFIDAMQDLMSSPTSLTSIIQYLSNNEYQFFRPLLQSLAHYFQLQKLFKLFRL